MVLWTLVALIGGLVLGVVIGLFAANRRRRREARRPASRSGAAHRQLDALISSLRSAAVVVGAHDEVIFSNAVARSFVLVRDNRIAVPEILDLVRRVRAGERRGATEIIQQRGFGVAQLHLAVRVAPLEEGLMVVLAEDRTPLLRMDETRRDFVANISHELKTPIGAISLLSEAVGEGAEDPEAVRHFAHRLHKESVRLAALVTQIIDLTRLQADDPVVGTETVALAAVVSQALDRTSQIAEQRNVTILRAGDPDLELQGDPHLLLDALTNLVQNAIAYSEPGSRVSISQKLVHEGDEDFIDLAVSDNGIGIKTEDQERIFERFYRVDYARSRECGGTGLGLSIVKHIAAVHGGTVSVWSRPGQGSTFTMRLPVNHGMVDQDL